MRGTDFRSVNKGILLIIARAFDCQRDADQGLARVGRFGDKCERVILGGIDLVDKTSSLKNTAEMIKYQVSASTAKPSLNLNVFKTPAPKKPAAA